MATTPEIFVERAIDDEEPSTPTLVRPSATTTPLPTPPVGKAVRWNEHVDVFRERRVDDGRSDELSVESEVVVSEVRPAQTVAGTTPGLRHAAANGDGGEDPFSDRFRLDDVPISLGSSAQDGTLQGVVQPVVQKLDIWTDPLETEGLPNLPIASGQANDEEAAILKEADEQARGLVQGATAFWGTIRKRRDSIRKMRELESGGPVPLVDNTVDKRALDPPLQPLATLNEVDPRVEAGPPAPSTGILAALMALQKEEHALSDNSNSGSAGSSALPTPLTSRDPSPVATPRSPLSPVSPTSPGSQHSAATADLTDDEEAYERERFIARLRQKRASKNALHHASASVAHASKHAAGAAIGWALHPHHHHPHHGGGGERGRSAALKGGTPKNQRRAASATRSQTSSPSASSVNVSPVQGPASPSSAVSVLDMPAAATPLLSAEQRSQSAASLVHLASQTDRPPSPAHHVPRAHSHTTLSRLIPPHSPPSPVPFGVAVPHRPKLSSELTKRVRRLGDRLGLELETSRTRPDAAQSAAGVFGGLVLSTVRLTGHQFLVTPGSELTIVCFTQATLAVPATPTASSIAPIANQHGYHVSRVATPRTSASNTPASSRASSPETTRAHIPRSRPSPDPGCTDPSKRKSLVDLVREEEERDQSTPLAATLPATSASAPVSRAPSPGPSLATAGGGTANAAQMLQERRHRKKRAAFTLQWNDQPPTPDAQQQRSGLSSRRPSLTIDTSASRPKVSPPLPSPTSPGRRRFLGGLSPKSPNQSFSSLHRDYFGSAGPLSPHHHHTPAEREHERAERKAREHAERELREREEDLREWEREKRRRRRAKEKELKRRRVFITSHVAAIIEREEFLLKLARAFMMCVSDAPLHLRYLI